MSDAKFVTMTVFVTVIISVGLLGLISIPFVSDLLMSWLGFSPASGFQP